MSYLMYPRGTCFLQRHTARDGGDGRPLGIRDGGGIILFVGGQNSGTHAEAITGRTEFTPVTSLAEKLLKQNVTGDILGKILFFLGETILHGPDLSNKVSLTFYRHRHHHRHRIG